MLTVETYPCLTKGFKHLMNRLDHKTTELQTHGVKYTDSVVCMGLTPKGEVACAIWHGIRAEITCHIHDAYQEEDASFFRKEFRKANVWIKDLRIESGVTPLYLYQPKRNVLRVTLASASGRLYDTLSKIEECMNNIIAVGRYERRYSTRHR